jgi:hypothetical protein
MYWKGGKDNNSEFMPDFTFGTNAKGEYKQLYDVAVERAAIRRSTGYELTEARRTSVEDYTGRRAKVEHALGWVFQNSERMNREVTLIAAYDLALKNNGGNVDAAIEKAIETRYENKQKEREEYRSMSIEEKIAYRREKAAEKKEKLLKRR